MAIESFIQPTTIPLWFPTTVRSLFPLMFSLQRRYLVQKIWSAREISIGDQVSAKAFGYLKEAVHNFLGSLDISSLRLLAKILDEKSSDACIKIGGEDTAKSILQKQRYLISRVWRWPDLKDGNKLKHIEDSSSEEGESGMGDCLCVNPFHLSRISKRGKCIYIYLIYVSFIYASERELCVRHAHRQHNAT